MSISVDRGLEKAMKVGSFQNQDVSWVDFSEFAQLTHYTRPPPYCRKQILEIARSFIAR